MDDPEDPWPLATWLFLFFFFFLGGGVMFCLLFFRFCFVVFGGIVLIIVCCFLFPILDGFCLLLFPVVKVLFLVKGNSARACWCFKCVGFKCGVEGITDHN